jgi:hypothetical protein
VSFVTMVSVHTGRKKQIPADWLDHPVLSKGWKKPPSTGSDEDRSEDSELAVPAPSLDRLPDDASNDPHASPTNATAGDPNTPAAGGEQEN